MFRPERMKFGIFLAPFHPLGENPTLALERDLELIEWLDRLGYDEAWIGEHHSAGWETIASPEIFIATVAQRTRHIKLGTGVISLPYHHPLMVANRMVLLDHLTRGRVMMGVGPGALVSDAYMLGIEPTRQREMMDEALGIIIRLFTETEPITYQSDWFQLHEARLHLRPYQRPHMPIAVAASQSPAGMQAAGKHGAAVLSVSAYVGVTGEGGTLRDFWAIAEETAARYGQTVRREDWRLVIPVYLAESREEALRDIRVGAERWQREYFGDTLGRPLMEGPFEEVMRQIIERGGWIVGTPDDCVAGIERLHEQSGGFGGLLVLAHEWAPREKILHSYELLARYVMPRYQDSLVGLNDSNQWAREHRIELRGMIDRALERAQQTYTAQRGGS